MSNKTKRITLRDLRHKFACERDELGRQVRTEYGESLYQFNIGAIECLDRVIAQLTETNRFFKDEIE